MHALDQSCFESFETLVSFLGALFLGALGDFASKARGIESVISASTVEDHRVLLLQLS